MHFFPLVNDNQMEKNEVKKSDPENDDIIVLNLPLVIKFNTYSHILISLYEKDVLIVLIDCTIYLESC